MNSLIKAFRLSSSVSALCRHRPGHGQVAVVEAMSRRFYPRGTVRMGSAVMDEEDDFDQQSNRRAGGDRSPHNDVHILEDDPPPRMRRREQMEARSSKGTMDEFDEMEGQLDQQDFQRNRFNQSRGRGTYNNHNQRGGYNNYNQGRNNNYGDQRNSNYAQRGGGDYNGQSYRGRDGYTNGGGRRNVFQGAARPMQDILDDEEGESQQNYQRNQFDNGYNRGRGGGYVNRGGRGGAYNNGDYNSPNYRQNNYQNYNNRDYGNQYNNQVGGGNRFDQRGRGGYRPSRDGYQKYEQNVKEYMYPPKEKSDDWPFKDITDDMKDLEDAAEVDDAPKTKARQLAPLPFEVTAENRFEVINRVMCPYHHVVYDNQLRRKYNSTKLLLKEMAGKLRDSSPVVSDSQGLPCPLDFIRRSPLTTEYRNKDEFSIWPGIDGNRRTVGFFVGEPSRHSNVICVEPDKLIISKMSHRTLAKLFQEYLREVSPLDVCTNFSEGGHWRRFIVRSNTEGEHMVICQMHPQDLSKEDIAAEMGRLTAFWKGHKTEQNLKSVYFQACPGTRMSNDEAPYQLLFGEESISETILGKKFIVSPESFFQVNTYGAEVLYQTIHEEIAPTKDMTLIDLCCGTGTVSTLLGPHVKRVIGIEQSAAAVEDARKNAAMNNVRNVTFINGKAEDEVVKLMDSFFGENIVLVANPARSGLRPSVISAIREMNHIEKVVYVACKPGGHAMQNFVHLALRGSNKKTGTPLVPVNAVPVDMFPQTAHCELVLTFERFMQ